MNGPIPITYAQTVLFEAKQALLLGNIGSDLILQERIDLGKRESVLSVILTRIKLLFSFFFFRPKNHAVYWLLVILQFASKNMLFIVFYHMIHVQQKRHSEPEF